MLSEWKKVALEKLVNLEYGKSPKEIKVDKSEIPIYGTSGIVGFASRAIFRGPSIMIGRKGTIDKPIFIERDSWIIDTAFNLSLKTDSTNLKWLYYFLVHFKLERLNEATGVPSLSKSNLNLVQVDLPPLIEQQKIAAILTSVDKAIEKTEAIIAQTEKVKKGLMQELLTKGIGHTEFKQTEVGELPSTWKMVSIDNLCTLKGRIGWRGYTREDLRESGPLVIGATQISKDHRLNFSKPVYLSEEKYEESPEIKVVKGDVILVKTGNTIGKVALVDQEIGPATINPNTALLKEIKCNNKFLFYSISSQRVQKAIQDSITVGAQPSINQKTLKAINVPLPSDKEQEKIVRFLTSLDLKIEKEQEIFRRLSQMKTGLMQDLFTGKVRVQVNDPEVISS